MKDAKTTPEKSADQPKDTKQEKRSKASRDKIEITIAPTTKTGPDISLG
jgi:hypothetical protein